MYRTDELLRCAELWVRFARATTDHTLQLMLLHQHGDALSELRDHRAAHLDRVLRDAFSDRPRGGS